MVGVLWALVSAVLIVGSALAVYEYRMYTPAQLARAPLLSKVHLAGILLMGAVGVGFLVSSVSGWFQWWMVSVVSVGALLVVLVQQWMHRQMGVERSPLVERFE